MRGAARYACALYFFIQGLCASTWAARIPAIAGRLKLTDDVLGNVLLCGPLASLCAMPIAGFLVARFGSRPVLRLSVLYQALGVCAIGWAPSGKALTGALLAYGAANTLVQISVNAQAVATERQSGHSLMASYHGLWSIGGFVGAAIAAALTSRGVAPQNHVSLMMLLVLILYVLGYQLLLDDAPAAADPKRAAARPDQALMTLGLLAFAAMFCETALFDWSGIYLGRVAQVSPQVAALAYAAMMAAMAVGRFMADYGVQRMGLPSTLRLGASIAFLGLGAAVLWPSGLIASCGFVLAGLGLSPIVPLLMGAVGRTSHMSAGIALAWASTIGFAGAMAAPTTIGWLSYMVNLRGAFVVPVVLAAGLYLRLRTSRLPQNHMANAPGFG